MIELGAQITVLRPSGMVRAVVRDLDERFVYFSAPMAPDARHFGTTAINFEGYSWLRGWDDDAADALAAAKALSLMEWDLHTRNASALFDVPTDGVTAAQRADAKKAMAGSGYGSTMADIAHALGVPLTSVKRAFAAMVFP